MYLQYLARAAKLAGHGPTDCRVDICRVKHNKWSIPAQLHGALLDRVCGLAQQNLKT